jgi:hypothetical protein
LSKQIIALQSRCSFHSSARQLRVAKSSALEGIEIGATNIPGVRIVGDLTGIPLLKFSSKTGAEAIRYNGSP